MAGVYHFDADKGSTWRQSLVLKNADGTAMDLTGYSARMSVKSAANSALAALVDVSCVISDPKAGKIDMEISAANSSKMQIYGDSYLDIVKAVYDIEIYTASGFVVRVLQGFFRICPEVTN